MKQIIKLLGYFSIISQILLSCKNNHTAFFSFGNGNPSHDTVYLGCLIFQDEAKIPYVIDTLYYLEFKNKHVLKTIDSIIKNQKVLPGRKWVIIGSGDYYKLIYSSEVFIFVDTLWAKSHYYLPLNDIPVFFKMITVPASQYTINKKHFVFVQHPPDTLCDIPFDHPITYYIDQKGKIIQTRFKDYYNR